MVILMAIGVACAKAGLVDETVGKRLSNLLLLVINPLVILLAYQRPFEWELLRGLFLAVVLGAASFAITATVAHIVYKNRSGRGTLFMSSEGKIAANRPSRSTIFPSGMKWKEYDNAIEKFACVYPNSAFLGIPLIYGIFGSQGVFYLTGFLTVFFVFLWTHGEMVMSGRRDFSAIKKMAVSPPMIAIVLGFAMFVTGVRLPEVVHTPLALLANTNTPLAMLVAGASICGVNVLATLRDRRIYGICAMRLLVLPVFVILLFMPFNIPPVLLGTIVVVAACPVAANIILFAYRHDRDHVYASQAFAASTILAMVTIPVLLMFL